MRPYNSNFWSNPSSRKIRPHPAIHIPITWTLGVDFCWSVPLRNPTSNSIFVCGPLHSSIGLVLNVRRIFPVELGSMRIGKRFVRVLWRGKSRAVAKFFGYRGHYLKCRRHEPGGGSWGYPPQENFQIWRLWNALFSIFHEICLRKIDLEYVSGKQLQVTITKITESKENNSIHRFDVSSSTGPGGEGVSSPLSPPPPLAAALKS